MVEREKEKERICQLKRGRAREDHRTAERVEESVIAILTTGGRHKTYWPPQLHLGALLLSLFAAVNFYLVSSTVLTKLVPLLDGRAPGKLDILNHVFGCSQSNAAYLIHLKKQKQMHIYHF